MLQFCKIVGGAFVQIPQLNKPFLLYICHWTITHRTLAKILIHFMPRMDFTTRAMNHNIETSPNIKPKMQCSVILGNSSVDLSKYF